ncbi:hypothetical protein A2380_00285 [candidate division WWE3 bacterium RIFOXYB1_FULL_43_24]|uniref:Uncharacterized protein n=2 Tax=Katanobacteria TaxID=422282 RepID=A0A0G0YRZ5_UNCKA|nr:MAG: hypothetical protein UU92_C0004G0011 [candidate division WWE3 bacterium GW2011_GWA1_42_12]KKS35100.1 MAG: hypothetical protein UU97_C0002G0018 [candidate division WWE3 bacterium GW2011_GWD1_42_14]KKS39379.1 MAG: hypothetical protein UV00_C0002G0031 [candidate division WWE3 bacterium GW2011_GWF1_42_14]KKS40843.1 MAG: hypothetical protein UV03_C0002G0031 [candidate division WWE3 bacterium GW2011_GWE1_42_16]KKS66230.1 MAG: hypothetical protein UV35_C0022G0016 [candidate division WWE3 bacte
MSANPFIYDAESPESKFELGEQTAELCRSLAKIGSSAEEIKIMDRRYQDRILEGLKPVISADREGQGKYKAFTEMHEITQVLQAGVKRNIDAMALESARRIPGSEESEIRKLLEDVSVENAEEKFASLIKIQDDIGQYYHAFMKNRYETFHARGRIKNTADEIAEKSGFLTRRAAGEEGALGIGDERISDVLKKFGVRSKSFAETVSVLNSKAKHFEAENLGQMEENFKNFNRVVVVVKNTLGVEK